MVEVGHTVDDVHSYLHFVQENPPMRKQPRPLKSRARNINNHDPHERDLSVSSDEKISGDIVDVEQRLRQVFTHSSDVVFRRAEIVPGVSFLTVYIDS